MGFSSRCTGPFRIFTYFAILAAGKRGTTAAIILQALLVQSGERRNAENLSETVPASARVMQRFLAESPWDDDTVIGRLQAHISHMLNIPLSKSSAFFKLLSICETLAVGMAIITP